MRIYPANARECRLRDLDVQGYVTDCVLTNAEAVVISHAQVVARSA
jgi:hypothetical protein